MVNRDTIFSVIVILVSLGAYIYIDNLSLESKFFPQVISVILIILNIFHLVKHSRIERKEGFLENVRVDRLVAMAVGIVLYLVVMVYVGFIISSLIFLSFYMWFLHEERKKYGTKVVLQAVVLSCVVVAVFYGVFHYLFLIPLPVGILFGG